MTPRKLQDELKKRFPFESPEQEANLAIVRTSDRLQGCFGRLFRLHGLTSSQYNVLRILRGEGAPLPCLEIGARMIQAVPAMTGLVDRLERMGLVRRKRCTEDRRVVYVELTESGRQTLEALDAPVLELHRQLTGHLTREELAELCRLLEKARERLGDDTD